MSNKLPRIDVEKLIRAVGKLGFEEVRSKGSHRIYKNKDRTKRIVIPYHRGNIVPPKAIKEVLRVTNITLEKFVELF